MSLLDKIFKKKNVENTGENLKPVVDPAPLNSMSSVISSETLVSDNNTITPMMESNLFSENGMGPGFSVTSVQSEPSPAQVFSGAPVAQSVPVSQNGGDVNLNVSSAVQETGALVDNPSPNALVDTNIAVNPNELFQSDEKKEEQITNIVQQDVEMSNVFPMQNEMPIQSGAVLNGATVEQNYTSNPNFSNGEVSLADALSGPSVLPENNVTKSINSVVSNEQNLENSVLDIPVVMPEAMNSPVPNEIGNPVAPVSVESPLVGMDSPVHSTDTLVQSPTSVFDVSVQNSPLPEMPITQTEMPVSSGLQNSIETQNVEQSLPVKEEPIQQSILSNEVMSQYQEEIPPVHNEIPLDLVKEESPVVIEPFGGEESSAPISQAELTPDLSIQNQELNLEPESNVPPVSVAPQRKTRFCDNCGEMITDNAKVCPNCGEVL